MASGMPWQVATALGNIARTNLVATGSLQSDGLPLVSSFSTFATVETGSMACVLPSANNCPMSTIYNGGNATLLVFPAPGESINGLLNGALNIPSTKSAILVPHVNQWVGNIST